MKRKDRQVILDPHDLVETAQQLASAYELDDDTLETLQRIVTLYPRAVPMYVDEAAALLYEDLPLADKFTFDIESDALVLFARDNQTLIDATVEMAMYLTGFTTKMGHDEPWITEFAAGAWKPVRKRIKRELGLKVIDRPQGVVGLPPIGERSPTDDPYPFRTLVTHYDQVSFRQMIVLAARDDLAVYFPPETHPKVRATYLHSRRAIQDVARGVGLRDYRVFNRRLSEALRRIENIFTPSELDLPDWLTRIMPPPVEAPQTDSPFDRNPSSPYDPFTAFLEQLFDEQDAQDWPDDGASEES